MKQERALQNTYHLIQYKRTIELIKSRAGIKKTAILRFVLSPKL